jgi:hypothetical protein
VEGGNEGPVKEEDEKKRRKNEVWRRDKIEY